MFAANAPNVFMVLSSLRADVFTYVNCCFIFFNCIFILVYTHLLFIFLVSSWKKSYQLLFIVTLYPCKIKFILSYL